MKRLSIIVLLALIILPLNSCIRIPKYITVEGKVERRATGESVSNIEVVVQTHESYLGITGLYSSYAIDEKKVKTDKNGNFKARLKAYKDSFVKAYAGLSDEYYSYYNNQSYSIGESILLTVEKYFFFKITFKNSKPFDENDMFSAHLEAENFLTADIISIEDFGDKAIEKSKYLLLAEWQGMNVNSIVHFKMPEDCETLNLVWRMTKNGVLTRGVIKDIPFNANDDGTFNKYYFEY